MPGMQAAMGGIMAGAEARQELQRGQQLEAKREELSNLFQTGTPDEVGEFFIKNPGLAKEFDVAKTAADKMTREEEVSKAWDIYTGKVDPAAGALEHAEEILKRGGNATESLQLAEMSQKDPEIAKRAAAGVLARYDTEGYKAYRESQGLGVDTETKVGAQEILEDGTIIQSTPKGPVVFTPTGERVKGKEAAEAVATARAVKVSNLRQAAGGKRAAALEEDLKLKGKVEATIVNAKDAAKASGEAFTRVEKIYENIQNMNEGIRLVEEEGAETGVIASRMPRLLSLTTYRLGSVLTLLEVPHLALCLNQN
jgi:hypothetical protein